MNIEKVYDGIRYTLSNDNLQEGDKVYSIANGRCMDNDEWVLHGFDFRMVVSGFPDEPQIIMDLNHSNYKPYQVHTDHGYSPIECYYKIIKKEEKVTSNKMFSSSTWEEI